MVRPRLTRPRQARGYTIIELVVVLTVVSLLASIGIPKLQHAFTRARMVEAVQTLSAIERSLKEHLNRTGEYPRVSGAQNPVTAGGKAQMNLDLEGWNEISFKTEAAYWYRYDFTTEPDDAGRYTRLTLRAFGDTDGDGESLLLVREYRDGALLTAGVDEIVSED